MISTPMKMLVFISYMMFILQKFWRVTVQFYVGIQNELFQFSQKFVFTSLAKS